MKKYPKRKPKQGKANWMKAFPKQAKRLHPESTQSGGVKAMSGSQSRRTEVYNAINALFKASHEWCEVCEAIPEKSHKGRHLAIDTHHVKGKIGLLLFDVRYFKATCRDGHNWIGDNPAEAKRLGLNIERTQKES